MANFSKFQHLLDKHFDKIEFEGRIETEEGFALYFYAPRVLLESKYDDAVCATIRMDCSDDISVGKTPVMMSPTRHTADGGIEDYDWFDISPTIYQRRWLLWKWYYEMERRWKHEKAE